MPGRWKRHAVLAAAASLVPISLIAQTVHYPSGTATVEAVLSRPAKADGKSPAVLVVHDDQGVTDAMRSVASQLAAEGFVVLMPNLVRNAPAAGRGRGSLVAGLPLPQTVEDVKAGFGFLQKDAGVDAAKISAIGFGWGGWRALRLAQQTPSLYRAVVYYATAPDDAQAAAMRPPILAHYAEYDFQTTGNALAAKQRLGDKFTYYIYPDTDRGFAGGGSGAMDFSAAAAEALSAGATGGAPRSPQGVAQAAAKQAWDRTLTFLRGGAP
jgi:carboxymethylenebutenolidase